MPSDLSLILKHFPELTDLQQQKLQQLAQGFLEWNEKINLISRKDTENLWERHILHSLGIAKVVQMKSGTQVMDVGTGGGFPGLPLAILFPDAQFYLVDSIGKKVKVVQDLIAQLELKNAAAEQVRAEEVDDEFDFVTARAVTQLPKFWEWVRLKINPISFNEVHNGVLYLKGGEIKEELRELKKARKKVYPLSRWFEGEFFETKNVVHVQPK